MNNNYRKGRKIEQTIVAFLKDNGYVATRSAGSKGAFDVIAILDSHVRLIQAKYTDDPSRSFAAEIRKIAAISHPRCATKELWIYVKNLGFQEVHFISPAKNIIVPKKARIILHDTENKS